MIKPEEMISWQQMQANARIAVAAPDLLAALKYMVNVCPAIDAQGEEAHQQASAAIAKAEGT
jgi:hypothetical protein